MSSEELKTSKNSQKQEHKIRVKKLQGSSYVISLEKSDLIGQGSFGKVVRAYDLENPSEDLCAKIIQLNDQNRVQSIQMELKVIQKIPYHPNLVNMKKFKLSSHNKQYFIMEYCNGSTFTDFMKKNKYMAESEIINFLQQFCLGYSQLHEVGIIHRDIKPDNILIHNGIYKIADFGLAKIVEQLQENMKISTKGTPLYLAPELIQKKPASAKVDIWSLGIILYRLLFNGKYPFLDPSKNYDVPTALQDVIKNKLVIPKNNRSKVLIDLCLKMLQKKNQNRISWEQLFEHELIAPIFTQQLVPENEKELESEVENKALKSSNLFFQSIEVMRISKIKLHPITQQKQKQKPENNINNNHKQLQQLHQQSSSSNNTQQEQDTEQLLEANHKILEKIIQQSKKRIKEQEICNKIENFLLNLREKLLFFDHVYQRLKNIQSIKNSKQLEQYQNQDEHFPDQEWKIFQTSNNYLMFMNLIKEDYNYIKQAIKEQTQNNPQKINYYQFLQQSFMDQAKVSQEFKDQLLLFLKHFNWIFHSTSNFNKTDCLVIFTYVEEILNQKITSQFTSPNDYARYFEQIQKESTQDQLYQKLIENLTAL
ncbi:Protein kinase-like domain [Pseudocohnilembus persalinus]|uniref:Protein kinase-like domain n=1 Tax=Pseudocohnilembus persalinus TaxID=266149 RepID=A0A0V0QXU1_PSEPJ|nr:Protein kinase-like domain [Pseudocohnilembus persalinus]|eukprot:KRX07067.1 Protein kinase-like domain [Pseudocohnilembus persalinus]